MPNRSRVSLRGRALVSLFAFSLVAASCSSDGAPVADAVPGNTRAGSAAGGLFDSSIVHDVAVTYDKADYDGMITTYSGTGEKAWIEADVTIDGVVYQRVGLRLKGNSSLGGLRSAGRAGGGAAGAGAPGGGGPGGSASADRPEGLPWLIRLDKYVDDQNHQGLYDLVVRSNNSKTSLNEAVTLALLAEAGLASQRAIATSFRVNGGTPLLRLIIENPDDVWAAANFKGDSALYKAESTGDYSYRGDDPEAYVNIFDQEAGDDIADLAPLIKLLDFLNNSDDATFARDLAAHIDVESFVTYMAMMVLVDNFDDIDGPGNNAYWRYDPKTGIFTIVPWDMNLAFGAQVGGNGAQPGAVPNGARGTLPNGVQPAAGLGPNNVAGGIQRGAGGFGGRSNILVQRFQANAGFKALYDQKLQSLEAQLYRGDTADTILATWVDVLNRGATALVDKATITQEAANISARFDIDR